MRVHSQSSHLLIIFVFWQAAGRPGCGKSFLLLQVVEHAIQRDWIVIYVPRGKAAEPYQIRILANVILSAVDLVNSTTSYSYDIRTQTYLQPKFSFQTLQRMLTVNKYAFENLHLPKDVVLEKQVVPAGTSLAKAIGVALAERNKTGSVASSPALLEGVMRALETQDE